MKTVYCLLETAFAILYAVQLMAVEPPKGSHRLSAELPQFGLSIFLNGPKVPPRQNVPLGSVTTEGRPSVLFLLMRFWHEHFLLLRRTGAGCGWRGRQLPPGPRGRPRLERLRVFPPRHRPGSGVSNIVTEAKSFQYFSAAASGEGKSQTVWSGGGLGVIYTILDCWLAGRADTDSQHKRGHPPLPTGLLLSVNQVPGQRRNGHPHIRGKDLHYCTVLHQD